MREILKSVYAKILIFTLVAFIAGFFWGWAWGTYYVKKKIHKVLGRKPEERHEFILKRLDKDLNFTPEQLEAVDKIVRNNLERMEKVRRKCLPEEDAIFREGLEEIEKTLSAEQRKRWLKIKEKLIKDRERFRKFHPPHGPPPPLLNE